MIRIVLELTEEEADSLLEAVEEQHVNYCEYEPLPEDQDECDREGPIAASLFDKLKQAFRETK